LKPFANPNQASLGIELKKSVEAELLNTEKFLDEFKD